ncbi:MAG: Ig-like domain-containing protein [Lachnospiraceae bacterium]|nr:Ig-like domain-containing protein [Lachnospiraceae bacterium]
MEKRFLKRANSLLLATAMAVTLMPAPLASAAAAGSTAVSASQQEGSRAVSALGIAAITGKEYTVIQGNVPVFPKKVLLDGATDPVGIQWAEWDKNAGVGEHKVTGTAGGTQITVTVNVLPCDEALPNVSAMGRSEGTAQEKKDAIHPLKGYKGLFVAEYDIVPDSKSTHDRAVIYLPAAMSDGSELHAENCWDTGARLQFKFGYNEVTYFQTQNGDGQVVGNAKYYPTNEELNEALANGNPVNALSYDEVSTYHVRTIMDTATNKTKGNYKVYITDPEGIEHEVTQPGGNGFRIYPKDGIVKNFAAVRGSYQVKNHKISWISGYATKKVETYLKAQGAAGYAKEAEDTVTKELPGPVTEQPADEVEKDGQRYLLNTEKSGWYVGDGKVASVTAEEGKTVTYRAYYDAVKAADKTILDGKIQSAGSRKEEDYTAGSWKGWKAVLDQAKQVSAGASVSQEEIDKAVQDLDQAEGDLVSIKALKEAVSSRKAELADKEGQKENFANWDEVQGALKEAEAVLTNPDATKAQVEDAEKKAGIPLRVKAVDKKALNQAIAAAKAKKKADYKAAGYQKMQEKLAAANKVAGSPNATQAEVDQARKALQDAVSKLVKLVKVKSVQPAAKSYKIAAGKKLDLKKVFTVLPKDADSKKLTYSIDKKYKNYASIKSGVVSAKKKGVGKTISVRAKAADGSGKSATIKIKIMKHAVTKVTVKKKSYTVKAGGKVTIKPVVTANGKNANKALAYTSSNGKLATVKNGVVTTKKGKAGKVTITIQSTDGTGKSVKVKINIKK